MGDKKVDMHITVKTCTLKPYRGCFLCQNEKWYACARACARVCCGVMHNTCISCPIPPLRSAADTAALGTQKGMDDHKRAGGGASHQIQSWRKYSRIMLQTHAGICVAKTIRWQNMERTASCEPLSTLAPG